MTNARLLRAASEMLLSFGGPFASSSFGYFARALLNGNAHHGAQRSAKCNSPSVREAEIENAIFKLTSSSSGLCIFGSEHARLSAGVFVLVAQTLYELANVSHSPISACKR